MTLSADRTALQGALAPIGLRVLTFEPDKFDPPGFIIGNPAGTYADDFTGDYTRTFPVTLLVDRRDAARAVDFLDEYIDTTGTKSVPAAIAALSNAAVIGISNFGGGYTIADIEYAGVTWEVQLL